jgi:hypothetical protein
MAQQPPLQLSGVSFVPTFGGGSDSADLWLVQLRSYFPFAPNLDSNAKKICFAATRMYSQALMWFQTWLGGVAPADLQSTFDKFADELLEHFPPAINVEYARLRLMPSSFPSGMSVKDSIPSTSCLLFFKHESPTVGTVLFCFDRSCLLA